MSVLLYGNSLWTFAPLLNNKLINSLYMLLVIAQISNYCSNASSLLLSFIIVQIHTQVSNHHFHFL